MKLVVPSSGSMIQSSHFRVAAGARFLGQMRVVRDRLFYQRIDDRPLGGVIDLGDEIVRATPSMLTLDMSRSRLARG